jgi:protein O-GlcNAc transferase
MNRLKSKRQSSSGAVAPIPQVQLQKLIALYNKGRLDEVVVQGEALVKKFPRSFVGYNILGVANARLQRHDRVIECLTKALKIRPDYAEGHNSLGVIFKDLGRRHEAVNCLNRALRLKPDYVEAYHNLGNTLIKLDRHSDAIDCFTKVLQINPDDAQARTARLFLRAYKCDWEAIDTDAEAIPSLGVSGPAITPFSLLCLEDDPARHGIRSERYAFRKYGRQKPHSFSRPRVKPDRLRIGYFSADFHSHAMMHLMAKLFEVHDRGRFVLHAYSYGPKNEDAMKERLRGAFDVFNDAQSLSDEQVATLARNESIDIAVDLNGYTSNARSGIFAYRAAPIQINYLGYPGTLGSPFIDYIVADKTTIPEKKREHFSEKVIYLPDCYQVNDNSREISNLPMTRTEMGLPEEGFVFCCFNNTQKILRREFNIWMRLIGNIDGSVLWLLKSNKWAEANLRKAAQARGIAPERLVFADWRPPSEHLARHRLADLFLDTFNYNAHTTASDALWAGLPVLTKIGQGFAARVAGSLLGAIGLPELITNTDDEYERLALQMASDPDRLLALRSKLEKNRDVTPLFDTELFARHIEDAYQQAYQRYFEEKDPDVIVVQE